MDSRKTFGRICFPGNPWPQGHAILKCGWSGRVERATGIWFDLHLESEAYYAADKEKGIEPPEEAPNLPPLASRTLWYNHHACVLSSTEWLGRAYGFRAGSKEEPLSFKRISQKTFSFDHVPGNGTLPRPFGIYRWGHEDTAYHTITFERERKTQAFHIHWEGSIINFDFAEDSSDSPDSFIADLTGIEFEGIKFPLETTEEAAFDLIDCFVDNPQEYEFRSLSNFNCMLPLS